MASENAETTSLLRSESDFFDKSESNSTITGRSTTENNSVATSRPDCWLQPCRRHPKRVEIAVFFYMLAFNGSVPLLEQFIRSAVQEQKQTELNSFLRYLEYLRYLTGDDDEQSGEFPGLNGEAKKCPGSNGNVTTPFDKQLDENIQSTSSLWLMYIDICSLVPAVFATLIICTLGDNSGRKIGIALPSLGATVKMTFFLLAISLKTDSFVVLIGSFFEGVCGSQLCFLGSAYAYVADTTTKQQRSVRFIVLATVNTIAIAVTQLLVGYLIDVTGYTAVFLLFSVIHLLNTIYILACIPNCKPPPNDVTADVSTASKRLPRRRSSLQLIKEEFKETSVKIYGAVKIFSSKAETGGNRVRMALLLSAFILQAFVLLGKGAVDALFLLGYPICFNSISYGYFLFVSHLLHGFLALLGVWVLTRCLRDITINIVSSLSVLASRLVFAYSTTQLAAYVSKKDWHYLGDLMVLQGFMSLCTCILSIEQHIKCSQVLLDTYVATLQAQGS